MSAERNLMANIFRNSGADVYVVEWLEMDGYAHSREFTSYRAAERYAMQVEMRLQFEAFEQDRSADGIDDCNESE